jgi:hypothetical protein
MDDLQTLLDLDGFSIMQEGGYWVKFEVRKAKVSPAIPHGIRYNLTLHDHHNQRVLGFDNAHVPKGVVGKKRFKGQVVHDHKHLELGCKGVPYDFDSPGQLLEDFWGAVDEKLREHGVIK